MLNLFRASRINKPSHEDLKRWAKELLTPCICGGHPYDDIQSARFICKGCKRVSGYWYVEEVKRNTLKRYN